MSREHKLRFQLPRPAHQKAASTEHVVYGCGECGARSDSREAADAHCICPKCKVRLISQPKPGSWRRDVCERCTVKAQLRERQDSLRRAKEALTDCERALADIRAEKAAIDDAEKPRLA